MRTDGQAVVERDRRLEVDFAIGEGVETVTVRICDAGAGQVAGADIAFVETADSDVPLLGGCGEAIATPSAIALVLRRCFFKGVPPGKRVFI